MNNFLKGLYNFSILVSLVHVINFVIVVKIDEPSCRSVIHINLIFNINIAKVNLELS